MLLSVQSHYRKVIQETPKNPESFVKSISPAFFEPVSADLLLLKTAVIAPIRVMIQPEVLEKMSIKAGYISSQNYVLQ